MELSNRVRALLSLLIVLHVGAVFIAPFAFNSIPSPGMSAPSPVADRLMDAYRPYVEAMYLQHGYAFFAPDPGPSHIFRAQLEFDDGRPTLQLEFPDRKHHFPRLLYHRHFMLSEQLSNRYVSRTAPPGADGYQLAAWRSNREAYEEYYKAIHDSFVEHLRQRYGAGRVTLTRYEHELLSTYDLMVSGRSLTEDKLYERHPEDPLVEVLP